MEKNFYPWSKEEKMKYSKQFSSSQRKAYRRGKKYVFMQGVFLDEKKRKKYTKNKFVNGSDGSFIGRKYTRKQLDDIFDDIDKVKVV